MSVASPPSAAASPGSVTGTGNLSEGCPLCGSPLQSEQEWCLRCGAAARTRLAAAPNWRAPLVTMVVLVALALGVLAAALVKLAGDSGPPPAASTTTVTTPATVAPSTGAAPLTGSTPTIPGAVTSTPSTATTTTPGAAAGSTSATPSTGAGGALNGLGGGTQAGR